MRAFGTEISGNRGQNEELSIEQRAGILTAVENGQSKASIARQFRCSRQAIYNTIKRWDEYKSIQSLPRSGEPPKLTRREKRHLLTLARRHPKLKYSEPKSRAEVNVHILTIKRYLRKYNIKKWARKKRPKLKLEHA
jgi:hypothetical protein